MKRTGGDNDLQLMLGKERESNEVSDSSLVGHQRGNNHHQLVDIRL